MFNSIKTIRNSFLFIFIAVALMFVSSLDSIDVYAKASRAKAKTSKTATKSAKKTKKESSSKSSKKTKSSKSKKSRKSAKDDDDDSPKSRKKGKKGKKDKTSRKSKKEKNIKAERLDEESSIQELQIDTLAPGVYHKLLSVGDSKIQYSVHLIEADIKDPQNSISIMKARNQIIELEKLQDMNLDYDSLHADRKILASVNGNFWKAYTNYPIGPVVIGGEIVELSSYKNWSVAMFDNRNRMYVDRFKIKASAKSKRRGTVYNIDAVNKRTDPDQITLYNVYGGDSIPYVHSAAMNKALESTELDIEYRDSSDVEFDTLELKKQIRSEKRMQTLEYNMPKYTLRYLTPPGINKNINAIVVAFDSFAVKTSPKTCILSMGRSTPKSNMPRIGDTLVLRYETDIMQNTIFMNAVSGTPRLVRNGVAKHEAEIEGSRGKRFLNSQLPRTAIGTDKSNSTLYIVAVEPTNSTKKCVGASLANLSMIMKLIGSFNAINLDGGGSTIMAIEDKNLFYPNKPDICRKLSVGVGISRKQKKEPKIKTQK
jgi:hypothetical protein